MENKKQNVYFFNRIKGFYRGQYSLKYFKDKFLQYNTLYFDGDYFQSPEKFSVAKVLNRLVTLSFRYRAISKADLVWVPAMAYAQTREWQIIKSSPARVIFDYYVSQYENLTNEFKLFDRASPEGKKLRNTEIDFMQRSETTLFLTEAERRYFFEYLDFDHTNIQTEIVPLVVDRRPKARLPFLRANSSKPVLAWWGTNLPLHGLTNMVEGLAVAKKLGLSFTFYLIINNETKGGDNEAIFKRIKELGLENEIIYQHHLNLHDFSLEDFIISNVDLCLGSFGGTRKGQSVLMNKIADAVSMSLPSLTEYSAGLQEYLTPEKEVYCCEANPEAIGHSLFRIFEQPQKLLAASERLEHIYESELSPNAFYKRLNRILR